MRAHASECACARVCVKWMILQARIDLIIPSFAFWTFYFILITIMSANKVKKVKMATKSCPECDQQIPVACKSCPCGYVFISRKLLREPPAIDKSDVKRRRPERIRREKINLTSTNDMENRRRSRSNSQSDTIRRGRGRPKTVGLKKQEEEKEKQEREVDIYANLSDEKAFVFSVALAEINRKILGQRLIL